jgi:2-polyprenyl-6-methoxyphenol hydroxylase-like FAD-dependent oxidoreductase
MTPWAGEGANIAMWDALDLAQVIGDVWDTITTRGEDSSDVRRRAWRKQLDPNLAAFEEVMQDRGARSAEDSSNNSVMLFADDAVEKLVAFFKSFGPPTE